MFPLIFDSNLHVLENSHVQFLWILVETWALKILLHIEISRRRSSYTSLNSLFSLLFKQNETTALFTLIGYVKYYINFQTVISMLFYSSYFLSLTFNVRHIIFLCRGLAKICMHAQIKEKHCFKLFWIFFQIFNLYNLENSALMSLEKHYWN